MLVGRAAGQGEGLELVFVDCTTGPSHDEGCGNLTLDLVRHGHDCRLCHPWVLFEKQLNLAGIYVFATADEHIVDTVDEVEETFSVTAHHVTRPVPTVQQPLLTLFWAIQVSRHDCSIAHK